MLVTQCLQNDLFLNPDCRLFLQDETVRGLLVARKDGRWMASVSLGNGQRKHFLGPTWADAHAQMVTFQKSQQDGLPVITERQTTAQYLHSWLTTTEGTRKPRTNVRYEELIRLHMVPAVGKVQLTKLTGQQLFDRSVYYFDKIPTQVEPASVALINTGAMLVAVVASLLPALRAARLQPIRALRFE